MTGAIVFTWGTPIAGREAQALAVLQQADAFWQQMHDQGRISRQRLYTFLTGDQSALRCLQIVEGEIDALGEIAWEKAYKRIVAGALAVVQGFRVLTAVGGDPDMMSGPLELYGEVMAELGFLPAGPAPALPARAHD